MGLRRAASLALVIVLAAEAPLQTAWPPLLPIPPTPLRTYSGNHAFLHNVGAHNPFGWQADYRVQRPGYFVEGLANGGEDLPEGTYEYDFYFALRAGGLPGLLSDANDIARVEAYDVTTHERLMERTFQRADFPAFRQRSVKRKTLIFSTWGRKGHQIAPRIYWPGLSGLLLKRVELRPLAMASADELSRKALSFEAMMDPTFLDRGFVVVRDAQGHAQDVGDAAIWTSLYAASQAWRYRVSRDPAALARMERSLWALHELSLRTPTPGTLVRYVDSDGNAWPLPPSKDTYTGFFFAMAQCLPVVRSLALRRALAHDVTALADSLLDHDLAFPFSRDTSVNLNPYIPPSFLETVLEDLRENSGDAHRLRLILHALQGYFWLHGERPVASISRLIRFLNHPRSAWQPSAIELLNDALRLLAQVQRNVHHSARAGQADGLTDAPYLKLDLLLLRVRHQLDELAGHRPIRQPDQLKILPSEALLALHIIKTAAELSPKPNRFETAYKENLWRNKSLLRTAINWCQLDEDFIGAVLGETYASAQRSGSSHLTFLALYDLAEAEKDPYLQFQYKAIFERQFAPMRSDGNAMLQAMENRMGLNKSQWGLAGWALTHYPEDRLGRGDAYWQAHDAELTQAFGGRIADKTRDPRTADLRPRDAFIWQRSARSLRGDFKDWRYPPMDFLFAYWLARLAERPTPAVTPPDAPLSRKIADAPPTHAPPSPSL